jgi:hypothetical protein
VIDVTCYVDNIRLEFFALLHKILENLAVFLVS